MNKKKNGGYGCGSIMAIFVIFVFLADVLPIAVALIIIVIIILGVRNNISKQKKLEESKKTESNYVPDSELKDSIQRKNEVISAQNSEISDKNRRIKELERRLEREKEENVSNVKDRRLSGKTYISHIDDYFSEAGKMVIDKDKASVGMLQREFKIGFNRAARIMDELCEAGVVGEEIGTAPRKVLMNRNEFEELLIDGIEVREDDISNSQINSHQEISSTLNRIDMYNNQYDYMTGEDFEVYVATILQRIGFVNVQLTKGSGDQGVDIIAEKDGMKYAFQCKRYDKPVGNKAVQEVFAGKFFYHCHAAVVVTNNYFTQSAKDLAHENGVVLWDRNFFLNYENLENDSSDIISRFKERQSRIYPSEEDMRALSKTIFDAFWNNKIYLRIEKINLENNEVIYFAKKEAGAKVNKILSVKNEIVFQIKRGFDIKVDYEHQNILFIFSHRDVIGYNEERGTRMQDAEEKDNTISGKDSIFISAGKFVIQKEKASIGMIQRYFKIGFNKASEIMDELYEAGVVGEENRMKPRDVLMDLEEFENYIKNNL